MSDDTDDLILEDDPLREVSEKLNETQTLYEDLAHLGTPQMPCPECGGRGEQNCGSLGSMECFRCEGSRMVPRPGAQAVVLPDFGQYRARLAEGSNPPTLKELEALYDDGIALARKAQPQFQLQPHETRLLRAAMETEDKDG